MSVLLGTLVFILPGLIWARVLRAPGLVVFGVLLSYTALFCGLFVAQIFGIRFSPWSLGAWLVLLAVAGFVVGQRNSLDWPGITLEDWLGFRPYGRTGLMAVLISAGMTALMYWRCRLHPLIGGDMFFRWNHLAEQMLALGHLNFYPPRSAADFHAYFYPDAFAPVASGAYWWLYACAGSPDKPTTAVPAALQYAGILLVVGALAQRLSPRLDKPEHETSSPASTCALLIVMSAHNVFYDVGIGQETGLICLALAGMVLALQEDGTRPACLAGICAGLVAACREYGAIFISVGAVLLLAGRRSRISWAAFLSASVGIGAPWYVRNWFLTGNPLSSLNVAGLFPFNEVHQGIMDMYRSLLGATRINADDWINLTVFLLKEAALPLILGLLVLCMRLRHFRMTLIPLASVGLIWLWGMGNVSGGVLGTVRMLGPAWLFLSAIAGTGIVILARRWWSWTIGLLTFAMLPAVASAVVFPYTLWMLKRGDFVAAMFQGPEPARPANLLKALRKAYPNGCRLLSDDAYLYHDLLHTPYEVVPVWGPEAGPLIAQDRPANEVRRALVAAGITAMVLSDANLNNKYLFDREFYREALRSCPLVIEQTSDGVTTYVVSLLPVPPRNP